MLNEITSIFNENFKKLDVNSIIPNINNPTLKAIFELNTYDKKIHKNQK
jgi:hypothetical protein